jgi:hypothetical protein
MKSLLYWLHQLYLRYRIMLNFARLLAALAQALALVAKIKTDVVNLHGQIQARDARIAELEAQVDPTAPAQLNDATVMAEQLVTDATAVDDLTPEILPPG